MELAEFVRIFQMRSCRLAWLLGAGASASSGIPTANQVVRDLKVRIYATDNRISEKSLKVADRAAIDINK